jgi:hypothetical protein
MNMAIVYTEAQRQALLLAYTSGVTSVSYEGKSTQFRNMAELKQLLDEVSSYLDGRKRRRRFLTTTRGCKGL